MQRKLDDRIGDLVKTVLWTSLFVYNLAWCVQLGYFGFFTSKPVWIGDQLLSLVLMVWAGWFGFVEWRTLLRYRTLPWFFRNLGVYVPLLFWRGLTTVLMWGVTQLTVMVSGVLSRGYPGRGLVIRVDFDDERDLKQMLRVAKDEGLPTTVTIDGQRVSVEEYDSPLSQHDLLGATHYARPPLDADIIRTYPPVSALGVVDATPTPTIHEHD